MHSKQLRVAWLGPSCGGLGWLRRRLDNRCGVFPPIEVRHYPSIDMKLLRSLVEDGAVERILWACSTRLDYPLREIEFLLRDCPEVPLAVACESWWDGSRRTGLGVLPHLSLPWYRWWDGWSVWLEGLAPELFEPCQTSHAPWFRSNWFTQRAPISDVSSSSNDAGCGIIVGNCLQTCNAWRWVVEGCGRSGPGRSSRTMEVEVISWASYQARLQSNNFQRQVSWVLWDDSCLDTTADYQRSASKMEGFFQRTSPLLPNSLLIAAISMPRAHQWLATPSRDQHEFIVKPDSGQALIRLLQCRTSCSLSEPTLRRR